jgi:uncharacterized membrane protein
MTAPGAAPEPRVEPAAEATPAAAPAAAHEPAPAVALAVPAAPPADRGAGVAGDVAIALLLRSGTLVAGLLLVAGLVTAAAAGRALQPAGLSPGQLFRLEAEWPEILAGAGVFALCLTPIARVALTAGFFVKARERGAALVAAGVLALLLVGLALGAVE